MAKTKQLYHLLREVTVEDVASYNAALTRFIPQTFTYPSMFAIRWPDGSPCIPMEMYLLERGKEVTVRKHDGGTLGAEVSQLSHLVRFCWEIKKDFWELDHEDMKKFVKYLQDERDPRHPAFQKRNNNTVIDIVDIAIRFLTWFQNNMLAGVVIVGLPKTNPQIRLKKVYYVNWRGKRVSALKFPGLPPRVKTEPKKPMGRNMKKKLWEAVSKMADPANVDRAYKARFASPDDLMFELEYLKRRRELLLELEENTGARPGEFSMMLVSLNENCTETNTITLTTLKRKTDELRSIPVSPGTAIRLELFIAKYRAALLSKLGNKANPQDCVFLTSTTGRPMSPDSLEKEFSRIVEKAGYRTGDKSVQSCLSMFRHRFITNMVMLHLKEFMSDHTGKNRVTMTDGDYRDILKKVANFTGHGSVESLKHYIDWAWEEMGVFDYVKPGLSLMNSVETAINKFTALAGDLRLRAVKMTALQLTESLIDDLEAMKKEVGDAIKENNRVSKRYVEYPDAPPEPLLQPENDAADASGDDAVTK